MKDGQEYKVVSIRASVAAYEEWHRLTSRCPMSAGRLFELLLVGADATLAARLRQMADELESSE